MDSSAPPQPPAPQFTKGDRLFATVLFLLLAGACGFGASLIVRSGGVGGIVAGAVFAMIGLVLVGAALTTPRSLKTPEIGELLKNGNRISTVFKAVDRDWRFTAGGQPPVVIYSQDAEGRTTCSESLWFQGGDSRWYNDPRFKAWQRLQALDASAHRCTIPVYVSPKDPAVYYMDLSNIEIL